MYKQEFLEEVKLIKEQNDVEVEMYPMVLELIQPTLKTLSKRYVFARRKTPRSQIYYGLSSFPDVAILDKSFKIAEINYDNKCKNLKAQDNYISKAWSQFYGCIEVKRLNFPLITKEQIEYVLREKPESLAVEMGQLIGEILWYKQVLYTNGIEWRYLSVEKYDEKLKDLVLQTFKNRIENEKKGFDWWKYFRESEFVINDERKRQMKRH